MNYLTFQIFQEFKQIKWALENIQANKDVNEASRAILKFTLNQTYDKQEYLTKWLVPRVQGKAKGEALNILGCALKNQNKIQEALQCFKEALPLCKGPSLINLTYTYSKLGMHEEALNYAIQSVNETSGKQKVIALHNTAVEYNSVGKKGLSQQYHQQAYELSIKELGLENELTNKMSKYFQKRGGSAFRLRTNSKINSSLDCGRTESDSETALKKTFKEDKLYLQDFRVTKKRLSFHEPDKDRQNRIKFLQDQLQQHIHSYGVSLSESRDLSHQFIKIEQHKLDLTDIDGKKFNGPQTDMSYINDTKEETFYETHNNINHPDRAASKIQMWYRQVKSKMNKNIKINLSQLNQAAIKIQRQFRCKQARDIYKLRLKCQTKKYKTALKIWNCDLNKSVYNIITAYRSDQTINIMIQQIKRKNKFTCQYDVNNIFKYYLFFEQFYVNHINDDYVTAAYSMKQQCQQGNIDLRLIIQLLYYQKGSIQLYGLTDVDIQPIDKSQVFTQTQTQIIDDQKIIKVQANVRGFLVRNRKKPIKTFTKQFACKLEQRYYFIRIYDDNQVKALDILNKKVSQNKIKIPGILLRQNDFKINSQTIQDIFIYEGQNLQFNEDAKYTLMRLQKKKLNNTPIQLIKSITLIQKYYRVKRLRDVLQLRIKRRKMKESILYTVRKNTIFSKNGMNYQLMLYAIITQSNSQALTIGASVIGKDPNQPYFVKFVQRVFSIIHPEELQIIARISLDHVRFLVQENQIFIQTTSIEEIKGNMLHKGMSDNQVEHYEPTFHGRNYFNKYILTNQYLKNTIPLIDIEYEKINHDPKQYMVKHITNNLKSYYRQRNKRLAPEITDLAEFINNFKGQVIDVQEIIDPQIVHDRLVQKMAKKILRSYKCYKFRKIMKKRIEVRKERLRRNVKKIEIKEHYYQIIQKPQPYDTLQILDNLRETYILLSEQDNQYRTQWLLMIPSFDIFVTVYSHPRLFYRIRYSEYHLPFLEKILQGSPQKIIQFFSGPIERNEPQNKQDFINDIHNQFAFKISRLVRIFMLKSQIKNLPDIKKVFIRQFITNTYYKISYHYYVKNQMILVYISNEIKKTNRSFRFELFQLDKLQLGRSRDQFLTLLCLEYRKNGQLYKQLMLPQINILHKVFKMDSDMNIYFEGIHIDLQEMQEQKQKQIIFQQQKQRPQQNVISLQTRWKMAIDRQVYKMRQKRASNMYRKLLSKKGRLIKRTFKQRCQFQDTNSKEMMLILIYFIGDLIDYHLKVEVMSYDKRKQKPFIIVQHFRFEKGMFLTNQLIHNHVLENLYIQDCNLILKNDSYKEISICQSQQSESEQSELIYHQRRDYQDGSQFQFQSIYSGTKPIKNDDSIRIDVDLKQFRKRFPQLNYKKEDILPKLSEQIVDSIKIKDGKVLTKQFLNLKMKGNTKLSEDGEMKQSKGINSKVLLRYSQIYKKIRYLITISIEEIPIDDSYEIMKHYDSNLIIRAVSVVKGKCVEWSMTGREAERLTGQKDPQLQAFHFKQNLSVLDDRMFYVANFEKLDFDNVLIMPFKVLYMIQRMIRNRKFRILRKRYEQEIQNIKERLSILIYYDICDFHSDENFITLVLDRKEYTIIAWNINNYKRYHLVVSKKFPKENFKQINQLITFKNDQLCM